MLKGLFSNRNRENRNTRVKEYVPTQVIKVQDVIKKKRVEKEYEIAEEIGRGKFGTVWSCVNKTTNATYAVKVIATPDKYSAELALKEIKVMQHMNHPRIVKFHEAYLYDGKTALILELVPGGELFERVGQNVLTEQACIQLMQQICEGMQYIHSKNILHLDMKPENIICTSRNSYQLKIADFGLAEFYDQRKDLRAMCGTPEFVAPEVITYDTLTPATDIWTLGVTCYILLSGISPFKGLSDAETYQNIQQVDYSFEFPEFDTISDDAKEFIRQIFVLNPRRRMLSTGCLNHSWLKPRAFSHHPLQKKVSPKSRWLLAYNVIIAIHRMGGRLDSDY